MINTYISSTNSTLNIFLLNICLLFHSPSFHPSILLNFIRTINLRNTSLIFYYYLDEILHNSFCMYTHYQPIIHTFCNYLFDEICKVNINTISNRRYHYNFHSMNCLKFNLNSKFQNQLGSNIFP